MTLRWFLYLIFIVTVTVSSTFLYQTLSQYCQNHEAETGTIMLLVNPISILLGLAGGWAIGSTCRLRFGVIFGFSYGFFLGFMFLAGGLVDFLGSLFMSIPMMICYFITFFPTHFICLKEYPCWQWPGGFEAGTTVIYRDRTVNIIPTPERLVPPGYVPILWGPFIKRSIFVPADDLTLLLR
jgi:hypothetical protein